MIPHIAYRLSRPMVKFAGPRGLAPDPAGGRRGLVRTARIAFSPEFEDILSQRYLAGIFDMGSMESISLKLPEDLLETSERCAKALGIPRAEYIRRAIERMNREAEARTRAERMVTASRKVRKESMRVNAEFARIERAPDA
jgi:predicted DNA-binding protein